MRDSEEGMRDYDDEEDEEERRESDSENPGRRRKPIKTHQVQVKKKTWFKDKIKYPFTL